MKIIRKRVNEDKRKESRLSNILRDKRLSFEELKYIDPNDFFTWDNVGRGLLQYTEDKLKKFGWTFGIYPYKYYIDNRDEIRNRVSVSKLGWDGSRDGLAKEILVAYCSNHDIVAEQGRINDLIDASLRIAGRFVREIAK